MESLKPLFPNISDETWPVLEQWAALLREWNEKINLVSRKDIERLETHHLAHCLTITNPLKLMNGTRILDVGTGGGLPGLPMAICYPQAHFTLVDSVGKKIKVVEDIANRLELKNVKVIHGRVESLNSQFDFVTGRAVTALPAFIGWIFKKMRPGAKNSLENGLIYWKGGPLEPELKQAGIEPKQVFAIRDTVDDEYFDDKYIFHFGAKQLRARGRKLVEDGAKGQKPKGKKG